MKSQKRSSKPKKSAPKRRAPGSKSRSVAVAYSTPVRNKGPVGRTSITVTHSEQFANIIGTDLFSVQSFSINPGLDAMFPWLSHLAVAYEVYRFKSIRFTYLGRCGSGENGNVGLMVDTDVLDPAPTNAIDMASNLDYVSGNPWSPEPIRCIIRPETIKRRQGPAGLFVRNTTAPSGSDLKTYDIGNLYVSTEGCTEGAVIGILLAEYTIELSIPQVTSNVESLSSSSKKSGDSFTETLTDAASQGLAVAQTLAAAMGADGPSGAIPLVGSTNITGIANVIGRLSSASSSAVNLPLPGTDLDPYVIEFKEDFYGWVVINETVCLTAAGAAPAGSLYTLARNSLTWPYMTSPTNISSSYVNYGPPYGSTRPGVSTTGNMLLDCLTCFARCDPGVGNTCSWETFMQNEGSPVAYIAGGIPSNTFSCGVTGQAGETTVRSLSWAQVATASTVMFPETVMVRINAKRGDCFSAIFVLNTGSNNKSVTGSVGPLCANFDSPAYQGCPFPELQLFPIYDTATSHSGWPPISTMIDYPAICQGYEAHSLHKRECSDHVAQLMRAYKLQYLSPRLKRSLRTNSHRLDEGLEDGCPF